MPACTTCVGRQFESKRHTPTHLVHGGDAHRLMTNIAFKGKTLYITDSLNGEILSAEMPVAGKKLFSSL